MACGRHPDARHHAVRLASVHPGHDPVLGVRHHDRSVGHDQRHWCHLGEAYRLGWHHHVGVVGARSAQKKMGCWPRVAHDHLDVDPASVLASRQNVRLASALAGLVLKLHLDEVRAGQASVPDLGVRHPDLALVLAVRLALARAGLVLEQPPDVGLPGLASAPRLGVAEQASALA